MFQSLADRWVIVEEDFDDRRWLAIRQILIGESSHRTFEWLDHACRLQGVLVGLILDSTAQPIADRHDDQAEQGSQYQYEGNGCRVGKAQIVILRVNRPVQGQIHEVESAER